MEDAIQPPANAVEIFLGCGSDDSDMLKIGVAATPDELFDLKNYPLQTETNGKAVRNFYTYYSNTAIGFSNIPTIQLQQADVYDNDSTLATDTLGGSHAWTPYASPVRDENNQFHLDRDYHRR